MDLGLTGKTVLVTGAASGIGRSTVEAFLEEECRVSAVDANADALGEMQAEAGGEMHTVTADLRSAAGCEQAVADTISAIGELDVLVNNVGAGAVRTFDDLSDADWHDTIELNFMSYVRVTRAALASLRRRQSAAIVNNGSDLARQPEALPVDYSVSKAAVLALTKALARAEAPRIRVNAVAPGPVWTPFWTKPGGFADTLSQIHGKPPMEAVEYELSLRQLPLDRLGTPEEVAAIIVFLASPRCSFVTGSVYGVDGGSIRALY